MKISSSPAGLNFIALESFGKVDVAVSELVKPPGATGSDEQKNHVYILNKADLPNQSLIHAWKRNTSPELYFRIDRRYSPIHETNAIPAHRPRKSARETFKNAVPVRRPRKSAPTRSPCQDDEAFKLDVMSWYFQDPSLLLDKPVIREHTAKVDTIGRQEIVGSEKRLQSHPENAVIRTTQGHGQGVWGKPLHTFLGHGQWPQMTWRGVIKEFEESTPGWNELMLEERVICRVMRMDPKQLLQIKHGFMKHSVRGPLLKKDTKKIFRLDVNKLSKLFDLGVAVGWIHK